MRKENRDAVWKAMPKSERKQHRRSSTRGQLLHPMYVSDYEKVTGTKISSSDKGFGNTVYKTRFGTLYEINKKWRP